MIIMTIFLISIWMVGKTIEILRYYLKFGNFWSFNYLYSIRNWKLKNNKTVIFLCWCNKEYFKINLLVDIILSLKFGNLIEIKIDTVNTNRNKKQD
jgi:hypothetical protein